MVERSESLRGRPRGEDRGGQERRGERRERDWKPDERRMGNFEGEGGKRRGRRMKRKPLPGTNQLRGSMKRRTGQDGFGFLEGFPEELGRARVRVKERQTTRGEEERENRREDEM